MNINIKIEKNKRFDELQSSVKQNKLKLDIREGFPYMLPCALKHNIKQEDEFILKIAQQLPLKISIVKEAIANIKARGIHDKKTIVKELTNELYNEQLLAAIENPFAPIPRKYTIKY